MGRTKFRKVTLGTYSKCSLCDYEVFNNKLGMKLHFKYSHPEHDEKKKAENK